VVTPSGQVGSIGVYCAHQDESKALENEGIKINLISAGKFKVEGNPTEPLSPDARAAIQDKVDAYYSMFVNAVARNRGAAAADVRNGYGEGRMLLASDAVKARMADRVATLDDVLAKLGVATRGSAGSSAAAKPLPAVARRMREMELQ
jgi:capsid assembly protease